MCFQAPDIDREWGTMHVKQVGLNIPILSSKFRSDIMSSYKESYW